MLGKNLILFFMHTPPTRNLLDRSPDNREPKSPKRKRKKEGIASEILYYTCPASPSPSPSPEPLPSPYGFSISVPPFLFDGDKSEENEIDVKEARLNPERLFHFSGKKAFRHRCKNGGRDFFIGIKTNKLY